MKPKNLKWNVFLYIDFSFYDFIYQVFQKSIIIVKKCLHILYLSIFKKKPPIEAVF